MSRNSNNKNFQPTNSQNFFDRFKNFNLSPKQKEYFPFVLVGLLGVLVFSMFVVAAWNFTQDSNRQTANAAILGQCAPGFSQKGSGTAKNSTGAGRDYFDNQVCVGVGIVPSCATDQWAGFSVVNGQNIPSGKTNYYPVCKDSSASSSSTSTGNTTIPVGTTWQGTGKNNTYVGSGSCPSGQFKKNDPASGNDTSIQTTTVPNGPYAGQVISNSQICVPPNAGSSTSTSTGNNTIPVGTTWSGTGKTNTYVGSGSCPAGQFKKNDPASGNDTSIQTTTVPNGPYAGQVISNSQICVPPNAGSSTSTGGISNTSCPAGFIKSTKTGSYTLQGDLGSNPTMIFNYQNLCESVGPCSSEARKNLPRDSVIFDPNRDSGGNFILGGNGTIDTSGVCNLYLGAIGGGQDGVGGGVGSWGCIFDDLSGGGGDSFCIAGPCDTTGCRGDFYYDNKQKVPDSILANFCPAIKDIRGGYTAPCTGSSGTTSSSRSTGTGSSTGTGGTRTPSGTLVGSQGSCISGYVLKSSVTRDSVGAISFGTTSTSSSNQSTYNNNIVCISATNQSCPATIAGSTAIWPGASGYCNYSTGAPNSTGGNGGSSSSRTSTGGSNSTGGGTSTPTSGGNPYGNSFDSAKYNFCAGAYNDSSNGNFGIRASVEACAKFGSSAAVCLAISDPMSPLWSVCKTWDYPTGSPKACPSGMTLTTATASYPRCECPENAQGQRIQTRYSGVDFFTEKDQSKIYAEIDKNTFSWKGTFTCDPSAPLFTATVTQNGVAVSKTENGVKVTYGPAAGVQVPPANSPVKIGDIIQTVMGFSARVTSVGIGSFRAEVDASSSDKFCKGNSGSLASLNGKPVGVLSGRPTDATSTPCTIAGQTLDGSKAANYSFIGTSVPKITDTKTIKQTDISSVRQLGNTTIFDFSTGFCMGMPVMKEGDKYYALVVNHCYQYFLNGTIVERANGAEAVLAVPFDNSSVNLSSSSPITSVVTYLSVPVSAVATTSTGGSSSSNDSPTIPGLPGAPGQSSSSNDLPSIPTIPGVPGGNSSSSNSLSAPTIPQLPGGSSSSSTSSNPTSCTSNQILYQNKCLVACPNGATNIPSCNSCPDGSTTNSLSSNCNDTYFIPNDALYINSAKISASPAESADVVARTQDVTITLSGDSRIQNGATCDFRLRPKANTLNLNPPFVIYRTVTYTGSQAQITFNKADQLKNFVEYQWRFNIVCKNPSAGQFSNQSFTSDYAYDFRIGAVSLVTTVGQIIN